MDSLATLDTVEIQSSDEAVNGGDTPKAIIRPKVVQLNTTKELREIREQQRRLEKKIALLTSFIVTFLIVITVVFKTGALEGGVDNLRGKFSHNGNEDNININCGLSQNKSLEICIERASKIRSSWQSIERSGGGQVNHFSLNGM